jgi:hypothetical protein
VASPGEAVQPHRFLEIRVVDIDGFGDNRGITSGGAFVAVARS